MRKKGLNLVHIFSILSAISIVAVALISGYLITRFQEKNMIEMDVNDTVKFVRSIIREEKTPFNFHDPEKNSHIHSLILSLPEIVRVKIFDRDKVVLWSDESKLIGMKFPNNHSVEKAFGGTVVSIYDELKAREHLYENEFENMKIVEIYFPIFNKSGEVLYVVETYKNPRSMRLLVQHLKRIVWIITLLGGGVLYLFLFIIVNRAYRGQVSAMSHADRLSLVNEISGAVTSSLDSDKVFETIADQVRKVLPFEVGMAVALYNPEEDTFVYSFIDDPTGADQTIIEPDRIYPGGSLMLAKAARDKKTYYYPDIREFPNDLPYWSKLINTKISTVLIIPLITGENCLGVFFITAAVKDAFSHEEIELLETVSSHLAIAIHNAEVHQGLQKANKDTAFINSVMDLLNNPFDIRKVLQETLEKTLDFVGVDIGSIYLLDEKGEELHNFIQIGFPEDFLEDVRVMDMNKSLNGYVVREGKSQYGTDFSNHPLMNVEVSKEMGWKSFAVVPIRSRDKILGSIAVGSKNDKPIRKETVNMLENVGKQVGVALENSNLFEELKRSYEELKSTQLQLVQAEKHSALGQLISGVAHELNNPLSVIMGHSQLMLMEQNEDNKEALETIIENVKRCTKIANNLLSFARKVEPVRNKASINECIRQVLKLVSYHIKVDGIEIELDLDDRLPETMVDEVQIQQVFINLIGNAKDAIFEKGSGGKITISSKRDGNDILVTIIDDGTGMDQTTQSKIFDPFFTTKEVGKGTGLGLSVSMGIINSHNGNISMASSPGIGSEVVIRLPIISFEAASEEDNAANVKTLPQGKSVLIVDDEPDTLYLFEKFFKHYGWEVTTATDGNKALSRIGEGEFDIILCDLKMPGLNGQDLYEILCKGNPELVKRMIISTGDTVGRETIAFLKETRLPYVTKPVHMANLIEVVSAVLNYR